MVNGCCDPRIAWGATTIFHINLGVEWVANVVLGKNQSTGARLPVFVFYFFMSYIIFGYFPIMGFLSGRDKRAATLLSLFSLLMRYYCSIQHYKSVINQ